MLICIHIAQNIWILFYSNPQGISVVSNLFLASARVNFNSDFSSDIKRIQYRTGIRFFANFYVKITIQLIFVKQEKLKIKFFLKIIRCKKCVSKSPYGYACQLASVQSLPIITVFLNPNFSCYMRRLLRRTIHCNKELAQVLISHTNEQVLLSFSAQLMTHSKFRPRTR